MRTSLAFLLFLSLTAVPAAGQEAVATDPSSRVSLGDFAFLAGRWAGTLEYLDYTDNRTRQTLQAFLDCAVTDTAIAYRFSYIEPNGKHVSGDEARLAVADRGQRVRLGGDEWRVSSKADSIVLLRDGEDAERPAEFRRTYVANGDSLLIRNEVRPRGSAGWFVRNRHALARLSP